MSSNRFIRHLKAERMVIGAKLEVGSSECLFVFCSL
jgi:hypothetical protein